MKHKHLDGKAGHVVEKHHDTYTCLSVKQNHGPNELNLYLDDVPERATAELFIDQIEHVDVELFEADERTHEFVKLTFKQPNGAVTFIYLDCRMETLTSALAAEQMSQQATKEAGDL